MDDKERQAAFLTALTTEHFVLQTAASATVSEAAARASLYVLSLSSSLVAMGFASRSQEVFLSFAGAVIPALFLLGLFTIYRLVDTGIENQQYLTGIARIRGYYRTLTPEAAVYFSAESGRWPEGHASPPVLFRPVDRLPDHCGEHDRVHQQHGRRCRGRLAGEPPPRPQPDRDRIVARRGRHPGSHGCVSRLPEMEVRPQPSPGGGEGQIHTGRAAMKIYVVITGILFGLITVAHVWRMIEEGAKLATSPWYLLITLAAAALTLWAWRLLRAHAPRARPGR